MDLLPFYECELESILWLQSVMWLKGPMVVISKHSNDLAWLLIPTIVLLLDSKLGRGLAITYFFADAATHLLKLFFRLPRPFWLSDDVQSLGPSGGYGMPSGHVLLIAAMLFFLAAAKRSTWLWYTALMCALIVGVSRVYLGVHFWADVVGGAGFAVAIALGLNGVRGAVSKVRIHPVSPERAMVVCALLVLFAMGSFISTRGETTSFDWRYPGQSEFHWAHILPAVCGLLTVALLSPAADDRINAFNADAGLRMLSYIYCLLGLYLISFVSQLPAVRSIGGNTVYGDSISVCISMLWTIALIPYLRRDTLEDGVFASGLGRRGRLLNFFTKERKKRSAL